MSKKVLLVMALWGMGNGLLAQVAAVSGYTQAGAYRSNPQQALLAGANAALLSQYKQFTATVYTEKRFLLNELSLLEAGVVAPASNGAFGLIATSFGGAAYSQRQAGLAYGRKLGEKLGVGVQFNYYHLHIAGYGNACSVAADVGLVYTISKSIMAGLQLKHLAGTSFNYLKNEKKQGVVTASIGYTPSETFYVSATLVKEKGESLNVQTALQYRVLQKLQLTGGLHTGTSQMFLGAGFKLKQIELGAVASFHPQLGISPGVMLTFKKEKE